ncbi:MAG: hypothetical protein OXN17_15765 [Candidatus Poribacteria bacterium]|nr:hypothetical protein [Candidatus Poribacteria bacterium]MDE0505505.1 hypothetical protein [Candidatus Poribacteria bacterium]
MSIHRFLRLILSSYVLLLIFGCGGGEEIITEPARNVKPDRVDPVYFPMNVGSRWVYRDSDGSEWVRVVKEAKEIGLYLFHVFNYHPPLDDVQFEFLKTPAYAIAPNRLLLLVENEIDDAIRSSIEQVDGFYLDFYKTKIVSDGELTVFRLPLSAGLRWDALNVSLRGGEGVGEFSHTFEADWEVTAMAGFRESVETPAGTFENCLKVEYETKESIEFEWGPDERGRDFWEDVWRDREKPLREELSDVFSNVIPNLNMETVWLAPGVGPVKMESDEKTSELIEYHLSEAR